MVELDSKDVETFLSDARRARDADQVGLVRQIPIERDYDDGRIFSAHLEKVVDSVGDCAAVPFAAVDGTVKFEVLPINARRPSLLGVQVFPALLGKPEIIRYVASYANEIPPDDAIVVSRPVRTDYREFADLLRSGESAKQVIARLTGPGNRRPVFVYGIGVILATGHQNGCMAGDAHEGNFMPGPEGRTVMIDHEVWFRFGPGTSAQCATDLAPLLPTFSSADWSAFRLGYLTTWPDGGRVIDLIEFGDTTGWLNALHAKDFARAVVALDRALDLCPTTDESARMVLLANRAYARSRNNQSASEDIDAAMNISVRIAPGFLPLLVLHASVANSLANQHFEATRLAMTLMTEQWPPIIVESARRVALHALSGQPITDMDLPFIGRRGNDLVVVPTTNWHLGRDS
ncbi:hypothetical protein [Amycolatopsis sp. lyj-23]|uniref:hypothetical protein n=1 Tax=Amycolatopsis sp. lyj-23 TaxID=2789283 RepID=UPI0039792D07